MLIALFLASLLATLSSAGSLGSRHSPRAFSPPFPYGSKPVRGVSLGGWLILEVRHLPFPAVCSYSHRRTAVSQPWITPSLFDNTGNPAIIDEWTFSKLQNRDVARSKLVQHWNTFITEADFQAIAGAGCVSDVQHGDFTPNRYTPFLDSITYAFR